MKPRPLAFSVLTFLALLAPAAHAQETPAPSPAEETVAIQAQFDQAKALVQSQDYAAAAALFEQIAAEHPTQIKGQKAAVRAAINWFWAGQTDKAMQRFDAAAAMAVAPPVTQEALYEKARFCEKAGRPQDALAAIAHLSMGYPESDLLLPALDVKGRILGKTPEQLEAIRTRETQARELLATARQKLRIKDQRPEVPGLIERIERDYADTAAAIAAQEVKGEALHIRGRIEEAQAVYQQLADRLAPVAPQSPLARRAKLRVPYEMLHRAVQFCEQAVDDDGVQKPELIENARTCCMQVISQNGGVMAARSRSLLVEIEIFAGRPDRAEALAEKFLADYYPQPHDLHKYPQWVLLLHLCVADAARTQHKYEKVVQKCKEIKQLFDGMPQEHRSKDTLQRLLQRAYFYHVVALIETRADDSVVLAVARELTSRFPKSVWAEAIRKRLDLHDQ